MRMAWTNNKEEKYAKELWQLTEEIVQLTTGESATTDCGLGASRRLLVVSFLA